MDRGLHVLLLTALAAVAALPGSAAAQSAGQPASDPSALPAQQPQVVEPPSSGARSSRPASTPRTSKPASSSARSASRTSARACCTAAASPITSPRTCSPRPRSASSKAGRTSYEDLSGSAELLTDSERQFTYYDLALGWNALPGEVFFGGKRAMPSAVYFTLGAGSTNFAGDDHFTVALGAGLRVLANDWIAVHLDVRDHMFESDLLGENKLTQNLQVGFGVTAFF